MGLKQKAEQKQHLQNLALRMLMKSEAKQPKALSLHSKRKARCGRGAWWEREPAPNDPASGSDLL